MYLIKIYKNKYNEFISLKKKSQKPGDKNKKHSDASDFNKLSPKNKHSKSLSYCETLEKNSKEEKNNIIGENKIISHEDSIDLVINNLKIIEFEKEMANLKSNIVFIVNNLTDVDVSQVFLL